MGYDNRNNRSDSRRSFGRKDFERREMHRTVCSSCGKDCEVPFKPTGSKPVYCSDCFKKNGGGTDSRNFQDRGPRNDSRPQNNEQLEVINHKLDKILNMLTITPIKEEKKIKTPKKNSNHKELI